MSQPISELMKLPDSVKVPDNDGFRFELVSDASLVPGVAKDMLEDDIILHNALGRGGE